MNKHLLKPTALLLTASMLASLLVGCKGGKAGDTTGSAGTDGQPTVSAGSDQTSTPTADPTNPPVCETHTPSAGGSYCTVCYTILKSDLEAYMNNIYFACDDAILTEAYKVAVSDSLSNVKSYKAGALTSAKPCIMAGAGYNTPWTRDCAINVWNAFALLSRDVSKNTLLSVLKRSGRSYEIDGQYWDAIIWAIGAYQYVLVSGDTDFLEIAQNAVENSLKRFEKEEYDSKDGLFRGAAVYGDGIAAYPDRYVNGTSGIEGWADNPANAGEKVPAGRGIPMKALSTNCVYYEAYVILGKMNEMLGKDSSDANAKAAALKKAINDIFWNEKKGTYDYLAYECDYQEALGIAYVLLFDIADARQSALVLENAKVTEQGIACVWPAFDRYLELGGYGRHSGTIWPLGQSFWARAAFENGYAYGFEQELYALAEKAARDGQFYEIYHPDTGIEYGGLQEGSGDNIFLWGSEQHQTWSATGYLSLIYYEILGAQIGEGTVTFKPYLPTGVNEAVISGFKVGNTTFDVVITRGEGSREATYETTAEGTVSVHLTVG